MEDAKQVWSWWQSLLANFGFVFTRPGWVRFVQWVTGMVLCGEEHTITQILVSLGLESRWRAAEHFAEYGSWDRVAMERRIIELIEHETPARWDRYHPLAVDDTKLHRASEGVWGTCTFHESTARSPNRAETVRAHNWVVMGDLLPGRPWTFLPHSSRLYLRKSQLPEGEIFRTKTDRAVEMLRQADAASDAPILGVCDGAFAMKTVVRPCIRPPSGRRRIEIVTRLRKDARLYHPLMVEPRPEGKKRNGRPRKWGRRMVAPQGHDQWNAPWHKGSAWVYGRVRKIRYQRVRCQWSVSGPGERVHVFVFEVEGYDKPWFVVTTAPDLSGEQVVEAFAARFRQEDGFRDHKQRLGMEECRAWTKEPVLRTFQVQMLAMTLLRLMQIRLDATWGEGSYWLKPEWNRRKQHPSILDLRRLFWRHRARFSKLLLKLEEITKVPPASIPAPNPREIAA
jgi:hypothetical protein